MGARGSGMVCIDYYKYRVIDLSQEKALGLALADCNGSGPPLPKSHCFILKIL